MTNPDSQRMPRPMNSRRWGGFFAFMTVLAGATAQAGGNDVPIPLVPLQAGPRPLPNLMFILDASGWMWREEVLNPEFPRMQGYPLTPDVIRTGEDAWGQRIWINDTNLQNLNLLAYSPRITYQPWKLADGTLAPAADPRAAYDHRALTVVHPDKPGGPPVRASGVGVVNLQAGTGRAFHVPRLGLASRQWLNPENYTLYKLVGPDEAYRCIVAQKDARGSWNREPLCTRVSSFSWDLPGNGTAVRSLAQEWQNYANWYAYHRTRIKVLKAGASHAFSAADPDFRAGFWSTSLRYPSWAIPVRTAEGRFEDDPEAGVYNRTRWFQQLYRTDISAGDAQLHRTLHMVGRQYFASKDEDGPWAPLPGTGIAQNHIACRRNLAVLATDGQWSDRSGYSSVGNADGSAGPPFQDGYAETLADVAYDLWKKDLRPDLADVVPTSVGNTATWQHLATYAISVVPRGTLRASDVGKIGWPNPNVSFPANINLLPEKVDDLRHAAINGRGRFVGATQVDEFVEALEEILTDDSTVDGSGTSLIVDDPAVGGQRLGYIASFRSGEWRGDLKAYPMGTEGPGARWVWSADKGIPTDPAKRTILTLGPPGMSLPATFPTSVQQALLSSQVASYLRGDRSGEGTQFRTRASLFGDVINASPVYLDAPGAPTLFVGANDGMLHAIDARTGKERFAYVPALLDMTVLKQYSRLRGFKHRYFVDGPLALSSRRQTPGKSLLVGTLGRGGRGVFGLDVSSPASFATTGRAWEYAGDDDMGMVLGQPQFARLSAGAGAHVIIPNGINSRSGKAVLYVLDAETGKPVGKIVAGEEAGNGLSTPTLLDADGDGNVDTAYAGDLRGNVWRFDLRASTPSGWKVERVFTATAADGTRQPITGGIGVAYHPVTLRPWVFVGTGRYLSGDDPFDQTLQSWYGVEDNGKAARRDELKYRQAIPAYVSGIDADGREGVRVFESARPGDMTGKRGWVLDLKNAMPVSGAIGGFPEGERMIGDQLVVTGNVLVATSLVPDTRTCSAGKGLLNLVEAFTGGAVPRHFLDFNRDGSFDGGDGLLLPGNQSGALGSVELGVGMLTNPSIVLGKLTETGTAESLPMLCANGAKGKAGCLKFSWGSGFGRMSWQERSIQ